MFVGDSRYACIAMRAGIFSCLLSSQVFAQNVTPEPAHELRKISVTATLNERAVHDVAGTVSVIDAEDIERELAFDIKDLIRYEPGVSVANAPTRFGLAGFNIRGIDGDRVLMRIDGARMADAFSIGSFSDARRNLIDLDAVRSVEIIRGPASALYGSDAIGGVVSFALKGPQDFLTPGERFDAAASAGYRSSDAAWVSNARFVAAGERMAGLLLLSHDDARETDSRGSNGAEDRTRTKPNPKESQTRSVLAKLNADLSSEQRIGLTINAEHGEVDTQAFSSVGIATGVNTTALEAVDEQDRLLLSLAHDWSHQSALFDSMTTRLYMQQTNIEQRTIEQRYSLVAGPAAAVERDRVFTFDQALIGAELLMRKTLDFGPTVHRFTYGLDLRQTQTDQLRDGTQRSLATNAVTSNLPPDAFPVRDFPKSETRELALFLQDELLLGDGLTVIPGVRVDAYRLKPQTDAIFRDDNPGVATSTLEATNVAPKLGIIAALTDELALFANYARGFRAPPYDDVNIGFTNLAFGYTAIANPELEPESSHGYEIGFRGSDDAAYFDVAAFYNDYEDFIESLTAIGMRDGVLVFQSRNVSRAVIYGAEARAGINAGRWQVRSSIAYARGEDRDTDRPLNSVDPLKGVLAIGFDPHTHWGTELVATAVRRKSSVDSTSGPVFVPPSYYTFDWLAHAEVFERLRVNFGVFNLLDRKYWEWADVQGRPAIDPAIDRYSRPGRHARVSATYRF